MNIDKLWYGKKSFLSYLLMPFSALYYLVISLRRLLYQVGIKKTTTLSVPVIVIGNITVGGTGKTPLVIWLVNKLKQRGFKPGVISRGYKGKASSWPQIVTPDSDPILVGDEPVLIARNTQVPVCVAPSRVEAGQKLLADFDCNVIVSDDGLQHFALARDYEVIVLDGERKLGNGCVLPSGPLRETKTRLKNVNVVLENGVDYCLVAGKISQVCNPAKELKISETTKPTQAVCAIGNPARFFKTLNSLGLNVVSHTHPDHYAFRAADIDFDGPVIMTEKDAVKCSSLCDERHYVLPVAVQFDIERANWFLKPILGILK